MHYLVADTELGNRIVPFAFKLCTDVIYTPARFDTKEAAVAACEETAKYDNVRRHVPVILEAVV